MPIRPMVQGANEGSARPSSEIVIGLDIGTSSVKGAAYTLEGQLLRSASRPLDVSRPRPGWAEQDPEQWWREVQAVLLTLGPARSVAVAGQANGVVLVDEHGQPTRPAIIWQDNRQASGGTGAVAAGQVAASRFRWLESHEPDALEAACWWLQPKDFINLRLTGAVASDPNTSVGLSQGRAYRDDLPDGLRKRLPPLSRETDVLGTVHRASVAVGCMDSVASVCGSGPIEPGLAFDVSGTSETVGLVSSQSTHSGAIRQSIPLSVGRYLHAGPTQAGGAAALWAQRIMAPEDDLDRLFELVSTTKASNDPIVFLPYLLGERAPIWDPRARGVFFGLHGEHRREDIFRAVLEGVAFSIRHVLESIEEAVPERADRVVCSGGAARDEGWTQIKADVIGRPVERASWHAGTLGAAMVAACSVGAFGNLAEASRAMVRPGTRIEPHGGAARERYDALYRIYLELVRTLPDTWQMLAAVPRDHDRLAVGKQ